MKELSRFFSIIKAPSNNSATGDASSSQFPVTVGFGWAGQQMSPYAVGLPSINRRRTRTSNHIYSLFYQLNMSWVTTTRVIANDVVENVNSIIFRQLANKYFVKEAVDFGSFPTKIKSTISSIFSTRPNPTFGDGINGYFRKYEFSFFGGQNLFHNLILS